jgi:hypothetical protein
MLLRSIARDRNVSVNSIAKIAPAERSGQATWTRVLAVVCGRSVLAIAAQALVAVVFWLKGNSSPWQAAAPWWSVYATLIDVGCLALMMKFLRMEGIGLRDLVGKIRWVRDPLVGIAWFLVVFPFFWLAADSGPVGMGWHSDREFLVGSAT